MVFELCPFFPLFIELFSDIIFLFLLSDFMPVSSIYQIIYYGLGFLIHLSLSPSLSLSLPLSHTENREVVAGTLPNYSTSETQRSHFSPKH